MDDDFDVVEQLCRHRLADRLLQYVGDPAELAADVDETGAGADGSGGNRDAFDHKVRVVFHDLAVFERAGLAFVGVADQVDRTGIPFGHEAPLHGGRESGAAAAAHDREFHDFHDLVARHRFRLLQPGIPAFFPVVGDGAARGVGAVFQQDVAGGAEIRNCVGGWHHALFQRFNQRIRLFDGHVFVVGVVDLYHRAGAAGAEVLDFSQREHAVTRRLSAIDAERFFKVPDDVARAHEHGRDVGVDLEVPGADLFGVVHRVVGRHAVSLACTHSEGRGDGRDVFACKQVPVRALGHVEGRQQG